MKLILLITGVLLVLAVAYMPSEYYVILRWVAFLISAFFAYCYFEYKNQFFTPAFALAALVFNPFVPIYLARGTWFFIDLVAAAIYFSALVNIEKSVDEYNESHSS